MKKIVFTFGRMNPPTIGHEMLVHRVVSVAKTQHAEPRVYLSHSQNPVKDPLPYNVKISYARKAFGPVVHKSNTKRVMELVKELEQEGFTDLTMVVGSDRVPEFNQILHKYNNKDYKFNTIQVVSAGERDPDAEGVAGMSASKLRSFVKSGDKTAFMRGAPSKLTAKDKNSLFNSLKQNMSVSEETMDDINEEFEDVIVEESMFDGVMGEFTGRLLVSSVVTHMMHLKTRSYAAHMALGAYYPAIGDLIDGIVESYQGKYGMIGDYPLAFANDDLDPLTYMEQLSEYVKMVRGGLPQDTDIQNDIDTVVTLIDSTIYKLKFLH